MKLFKAAFILFCIMTFIGNKINANDNIISIFVKQYPLMEAYESTTQGASESISEALRQPSFIFSPPKKTVRKAGSGVESIQSSYLGFLATSSQSGQILFPRKQQSNTINILITKQISPVFMIAPATIHHWELKEGFDCEMYEMKQSQDEKSGLYYVETQKVDLPKNKHIQLNTIIIFADPKEIYVPIGATIVDYTSNLILPDIYAKNVNVLENALYTLSIKQYFKQINKEYKNDTQDIATIIANS